MRPDTAVADASDLELRLVDPAKNARRIYGLTECVTLFGELCLRIVWGRIGNRRLRERSELFTDRAALVRRRKELLDRRQRHGYVPTSTPSHEPAAAAAAAAGEGPNAQGACAAAAEHAVERAILEDHGLPVEDAAARALVARWHAATLAIVRYLEAKGAELLDLVDASTLAGMFVQAGGAG